LRRKIRSQKRSEINGGVYRVAVEAALEMYKFDRITAPYPRKIPEDKFVLLSVKAGDTDGIRALKILCQSLLATKGMRIISTTYGKKALLAFISILDNQSEKTRWFHNGKQTRKIK